MRIWLSIALMVSGLTHAGDESVTTVMVTPSIQGVTVLELSHSAAVSADQRMTLAYQGFRHQASNGREARVSTLAVSSSHRMADGGSLMWGINFLPQTTFNCLKVGQEFVGRCTEPTIEIRENGQSADPLTLAVSGVALDWMPSSRRFSEANVSLSLGVRAGHLNYDSPFLGVTNPFLLSSVVNGQTLSTLRDDFLQKYPTSDLFAYGVAGFRWKADWRVGSQAIRSSVDVNHLLLPGSDGQWSPRRTYFRLASEVPLGNSGHAMGLSVGTQLQSTVDVLTINPWTTGDALQLYSRLSWLYRF